MTLTFNDGESFDPSGPYRIEERCDGLYVVGGGMLCPCSTRDEAEELIGDLTSSGRSQDGAR